MHVLVSCKNEEDPIKMKAVEYSQHFSFVSLWGFFRRSRAANSAVHGPIRRNLEHSPDLTAVLVTCKNEDDSIKNEGARVFTSLYIDFSDAQGQLTP